MIIDEPKITQIPALRRLWREAFGDTEAFLDAFMATAFRPHRSRCVTINDDLAAALYWFDCWYDGHCIAYLYAVATAKAYRGQGLCRKLMEDTHRHLAARGYEAVILVPGSSELFGFYERMGYRTSCYVREFACSASDKQAEVQPIKLEEYAKLRRELLPIGGVIQEGENLAFLKTQASFYKGENCVLAARGEGDTLRVLELLGDDSEASGIVRALGYQNGSFRASGNAVPFAMIYPLCAEKITPTYFGLAFD